MESIKDFTHIDLKHLESIRLPVSSCQDKQENVVFEFLDVDSIAPNAFDDFPLLKCLHLRLKKQTQIDLKQTNNLKDLCLETLINDVSNVEADDFYLNGNLPTSLEKLSLIGFNIKLESLIHLKNLTFLQLFRIRNISINAMRPFHFFSNLKQLIIHNSCISFESSEGEHGCNEIRLDCQQLEEVTFKRDGFQTESKTLKIYFENLPQLKKLHLIAYNLYEIDVATFKLYI